MSLLNFKMKMCRLRSLLCLTLSVLFLFSRLSCVQSQVFRPLLTGIPEVEVNPVSHTCGHPDSGMTSHQSYVWQLLQEGLPGEERPCDYSCVRTFDENFSRLNRLKIENFNQFGQYHRQSCDGYLTGGFSGGSGSGSGVTSPVTTEYVTTIEVDNQCAIKDLRFAERSLFFYGNTTHSMTVKVDDDSHNDS